MSYKIKSLIYFACFVAVAVYYHQQTEAENNKGMAHHKEMAKVKMEKEATVKSLELR